MSAQTMLEPRVRLDVLEDLRKPHPPERPDRDAASILPLGARVAAAA